MSNSLLNGLVVLELADRISGPYCARLLAALGAEVVKIEDPASGDVSRRIGPFLSETPGIETSSLYLYLNMGKKSITLQLGTSSGSQILEQLVNQADVLIENQSPGYLNTLGLSHERLCSNNPRLVLVSLSNFGDEGPYSKWQTTPLVNLALGGYLYLSGDENREPLALPGWQPDYLAGLHGYMGCLVALWEREQTGIGQRVEVATMDLLATLHQFTTVMYTYEGNIRRRHGNRWEALAPYGRYPNTVLSCRNGHVSFSVSAEHQWELVCQMIGRPDLIEDPRLQNFQDRRYHADELDAVLIDWLKDKTKEEVFQLAAGLWSVPVGPVLDISEVMADPQYRSRGFFATVDHPIVGKLDYPSMPFTTSDEVATPERAPLLGEHNRDVYCGRLGYSAQELVLLREMQVV